MAHHVQRLVALAGLLLTNAGALHAATDFSHDLHLKLVPKCVTCHANATSSKAPSDNLLPDKQSCVQCHPDGRSVKQPTPTVIAKFSHEFHVKLGRTVAPTILAALERNRYLAPVPAGLKESLQTPAANTECGGCHRGPATLPHMADCLTCHNKIDPPDSCATCHSAATMKFRPANHTPDFLDTHTTGKIGLDKTTCAVCHSRRFTCLGCH